MAAVNESCDPKLRKSDWNFEELLKKLRTVLPIGNTVSLQDIKEKDHDQLVDLFTKQGHKFYDMKEQYLTESGMNMRELERYVVLNIIDRHWVDHLRGLDDLRDGVGMQSYAQKDPLVEYTKESHIMFEAMYRRFKEDSLRYIFMAQVVKKEKSVYDSALTATHGGTVGKRRPMVKKEKIWPQRSVSMREWKKYKNCCGKKEGVA